MKSSISNLQSIVLISVLSVILLLDVVSSLHNGYYTQIADAKKGRHESKDTTDSAVSSLAQQQPLIPGAIQLSAEEQHSGYRWINTTNGVINPTMNFNVGTAKTIQLQNPTDSKHQLLIDDPNGNQLATSGDIVSGSSSQLSFKPSMTGIFGYHCIHHPTTMKGIIHVHEKHMDLYVWFK
jgi:plastocyanin